MMASVENYAEHIHCAAVPRSSSAFTNRQKISARKSSPFAPYDAQRPGRRPYPQTGRMIPMSSPKQIEANRANSLLSTGPSSPEGKTKVSHNALKTGLTGRTVLLPIDDVAAYQAHTDRVFKQWAAETDEEKRLTQSIVDTLWRLDRIPALEAGIYAIGRRELACQFADEQDETVRKAMIEAQIFLTYRRDLNNLSIQESRLRRLFEKDEAELKRLMFERQKAAE